MANPHPQPHPENLKNFKRGDPTTVEKGRKGGKASQQAQKRKRTMREWAQLYGELPLHEGKVKDPKAADEIRDEEKSNPTMDGAIIAAAYNRAIKGDIRATQFLASLKGQFVEEITVHTDPIETLTEEQVDAILEAITNRKDKRADE